MVNQSHLDGQWTTDWAPCLAASRTSSSWRAGFSDTSCMKSTIVPRSMVAPSVFLCGHRTPFQRKCQSMVDGEQVAGLGVVLVQFVQHQRDGSAQQFGHGRVFHGLSSRHDMQEGRSHWENAPQVSEQLSVGLHSNEQRVRPSPGLVGHADGAIQDVFGGEVRPELLQGE